MQLLDGLGLKIGLLNIKWKTKALNRLLIKWGNAKLQFWSIWFDIGAFSSLIFFIVALYLVFSNTFKALSNSTAVTEPLITPVVPGVNLPITELGYYCVALFICSVVHELGHALASILDDVGIQEFGCNLYFILPVAYVSLPTDKLSVVSLWKQLRIFTAGIWHNIVVVFLGYLLFCSIPTLFSPFYVYNSGVVVSKVLHNSPLKDPSRGLFIDDVIIGINDCPVISESDWYECLNNKDALRPAVCVNSDLVHALDESVPLKHLGGGYVECCDSKNTRNLCFEYIELGNNELELPGHVCLPGRIVMEKSSNFCTVSPHSCPGDLYCFKPILPNNTFLFKLYTKTKDVIYLGHPTDLIHTIEISPYVRKSTLYPINLPYRLTKLSKYLIVMSLGLAFVNVLPFTFMDGQYILEVVGLMLLQNKINQRQIMQVTNALTWISTFAFVVYLLCTLVVLV